MAQMPGMKSRAGSNPAGFPWRQPTDPFSPAITGPFSQTSRLEELRRTPSRLDATTTINRQRYKEFDNGRAGVLVPMADPMVSPAELAAQRRAIEQAFFVAGNPMAGVFGGVATLAGGSPEVRERAIAAGAIADTALSVVAPRNAPVRRPAAAPIKVQPTVPLDGSRRLREDNSLRQAQGVNLVLAAPLRVGTEPKRSLKPPGFVSGNAPYGHSRGHLQGAQLGGVGDDIRNMVTLTQNPTNSPWMRDFENDVARRVRSGEIVDNSITPFYSEGVLPPSLILLMASGDREGPKALIVGNAAGRPPK